MGGPKSFEGRSAARRRRMLAVAALAILVLAGTACEPVLHPNFAVVEPAGGPVRLLSISDDGRYSFVRATAAGATVAGPGFWRVDRTDGTVVELPNGRASSDGERWFTIDLLDLSHKIWEGGVTTTAPIWTVPSQNMRWGLFFDGATQHYHRWEKATGAIIDVEAGHPLPAGYDHRSDPNSLGGISDDGNIVWFPLRDTTTGGCVVRFMFLPADLVVDVPSCIPNGDIASSGTMFVRKLEPYATPPELGVSGWRSLELVSVFGTAPTVVLTLPPLDPQGLEATWFGAPVLSDNGMLWVAKEHLTIDPVLRFESQVLAVNTTGQRTFPDDSGLVWYSGRAGELSTSSSGRWAAAHLPAGPNAGLHVFDHSSGNDEVLTVPVAATGTQITSDGSVVAHRGGNLNSSSGWYEHVADPPAGP